MRDIIFKAKRRDNKKWIEGYYCKYGDNDCIIEPTTFGLAKGIGVIPETVGQYTGLNDKNGKKVFEGDIVKCTDTTYDYSFKAVVVFGNPNGEYSWGFQLKRISGASANTDILLWFDMDDVGACTEVVGNIYDNKVR